MLILTRKISESIMIGDGIKVTLVAVRGDQVRLGITADPNVKIYRDEIWRKINAAANEHSAPAPENPGTIEQRRA